MRWRPGGWEEQQPQHLLLPPPADYFLQHFLLNVLTHLKELWHVPNAADILPRLVAAARVAALGAAAAPPPGEPKVLRPVLAHHGLAILHYYGVQKSNVGCF